MQPFFGKTSALSISLALVREPLLCQAAAWPPVTCGHRSVTRRCAGEMSGIKICNKNNSL